MIDYSAHTTAVYLLRSGLWPVVIQPGEKRPIGRGLGVNRATEDSIDRLFDKHPAAGCGLCIGPGRGPGGTWLFDFEADGPEAEMTLLKLFGGPPTRTMSWRSTRGRHRLYTGDGDRLLRLLAAAGAKEGTGIKSGVWHLEALPDLENRVGGYHQDGSVKQVQSVVPPTPGTDDQARQWMDGEAVLKEPAPVAELPEIVYLVLEEIAERAAQVAADRAHEGNGRAPGGPPKMSTSQAGADAYAHAALESECAIVAQTSEGQRNNRLNKAAFNAGQFVPSGALDRSEVQQRLLESARQCGLPDQEAESAIRSGLTAGEQLPRDLSHMGAGRNGTPAGSGTAAPPAASGPPDFDGPPLPLGVQLLPVPALDPRMLPEAFRGWLADSAERMSAPLDYFAAPAVVALGAVVGRKLCVRPKRRDDWRVCPNLWGAAVGPPSVLKSACIEEGLRPLNRLAWEAMKQHEQAEVKFNEDALIAKTKAEAAKNDMEKAARKKGTSDEDLRLLAKNAAQAEDLIPPPARRYIVNDTTVEKLGELLSENPNGLLLFRDELIGFPRSLDRQGHESDRAFYLESWNGFGSYAYDRIGRGTIIIPSVCMSIFGGIQPGPHARYLRAAASGDEADGLIPRFQLLVYPDLPATWINVDRWPDTEAKNRAYRVFQALHSLAPAAIGAVLDDERRAYSLGFGPEAQELFDEWREALENRLRSGCDNPLIVAHLAKYRSLMPTLALLFYLIEVTSGRIGPGPITERPTLAAAAWCEHLEAHARRAYQSALDGDPETAAQLAERIKTSLPNPFRVRDVVRKGWAGLDRIETVERTLLVLEDRRWVKGVESLSSTSGGRPTVDYWINPAIRPSTPAAGDAP